MGTHSSQFLSRNETHQKRRRIGESVSLPDRLGAAEAGPHRWKGHDSRGMRHQTHVPHRQRIQRFPFLSFFLPFLPSCILAIALYWIGLELCVSFPFSKCVCVFVFLMAFPSDCLIFPVHSSSLCQFNSIRCVCV